MQQKIINNNGAAFFSPPREETIIATQLFKRSFVAGAQRYLLLPSAGYSINAIVTRFNYNCSD